MLVETALPLKNMSWSTWGLLGGLVLGLPMLVSSFSMSLVTKAIQPRQNHFLTYLRLADDNGHDNDFVSTSKSLPKNSADGNGIGLNIADDTGDDLTKYEFGLRLKEVREYYRETNEMSQEKVCFTLFRTRLQNLRLNRCFVGAESTIPGAGRGLFASRDIEEGELITLYPGDMLLEWKSNVGDFAGDVGVMFGNHVKKEDQQSTADRMTTNNGRSYELKIGNRHSIVADPLLADDAAYLGHLGNDAAMLNSRDQTDVATYIDASLNGRNSDFFVLEGSHMVCIATTNITKGNEIFASYGCDYWFSRSSATGPL